MACSVQAAGSAHQIAGRDDDATRAFELMVELSGRSPFLVGLLGSQYARTGRVAEARALDAELAQIGGQRASRRAMILWLLGDEDRAFELLREGAREHDAALPQLARTPGMESLAADPRWHALMREIGLDEVARMYESRTWGG